MHRRFLPKVKGCFTTISRESPYMLHETTISSKSFAEVIISSTAYISPSVSGAFMCRNHIFIANCYASRPSWVYSNVTFHIISPSNLLIMYSISPFSSSYSVILATLFLHPFLLHHLVWFYYIHSQQYKTSCIYCNPLISTCIQNSYNCDFSYSSNVPYSLHLSPS